MELTRRERQCVQLAGEGLSNKKIALRLSRPESPLTANTVKNHLAAAFQKLDVSNRHDAAERLNQIDPVRPSPDAAAVDVGSPERADAPVSAADGGDGGALFNAYAGLGRWRTPPRIGGTRTPIIFLWAFLGLMLIGIGLGALSVVGSADRLAAASYSTG